MQHRAELFIIITKSGDRLIELGYQLSIFCAHKFGDHLVIKKIIWW